MKFILLILLLTSCVKKELTPTPDQTNVITEKEIKNVIKVATGEWHPYTTEKREDKGCLLKMVADAFATEGIKIEPTFMPWKVAYKRTKAGLYHASVYWYDSKERREDFLLSDQNVSVEYSHFFYNKNKPLRWSDWKDLKDKTIIINEGFTYSDDFFDLTKKHNVNLYKVFKREQNLKMILKNRADATIFELKSGLKEIENAGAEAQASIVPHKKPVFATKGYVLFSKNNPESKKYLEIFNRGIKKLFSDPKYAQNYRKNCTDF